MEITKSVTHKLFVGIAVENVTLVVIAEIAAENCIASRILCILRIVSVNFQPHSSTRTSTVQSLLREPLRFQASHNNDALAIDLGYSAVMANLRLFLIPVQKIIEVVKTTSTFPLLSIEPIAKLVLVFGQKCERLCHKSWWLNHEGKTLKRKKTQPTGRVSLPLKILTQFQRYHRQLRWLPWLCRKWPKP